MTPTELHSRILLHELRTILLDETREGGQIPQEWKDCITNDPHNPANYLVLGDLLDNEGDPLGELCRIQVELIGVIPSDRHSFTWRIGDNHHFLLDWQHFNFQVERDEHALALTMRRVEIVGSLYQFEPTGEPDMGREYRTSRLGRTTRMLTDILRYCDLNQEKNILVVHLRAAQTFLRMEELYCEIRGVNKTERFPRDYVGNPTLAHVWKNTIRFLAPRVIYPRADITFTDHACQEQELTYPGGRRTASDQVDAFRYAMMAHSLAAEDETLTCIGGPFHGQNRTIRRGQTSLQYSQHEPVSVTEWLNEDEFERREAYQVRYYRRERFSFPRPRPLSPRPHFTQDYLIHEDLSNDQALEMIHPGPPLQPGGSPIWSATEE